MFNLRALVVTLAVVATGILGQLVNPIQRPTVGDILVAGGTFDILWTVTTPGVLVSLILRQGPSNNIGVVGPIADSIQNTGEYLWHIPSNLPSGNDYAIQIIIGPASNVSNVGPDAYNFTPLLTLVNNGTASTNGTTSATASGSRNTTVTTSSAGSSQTSSIATTAGSTAKVTLGSTQTPASTAHSAATRIETVFLSGHGIFALIVALAVGMVTIL